MILPGTHMRAVILMAYGSPNSLDEVGDYLAQIKGRRASPAEIEHLQDRYRQVGGKTPLLKITRSQARALEQKLHAEGVPVKVYFGMKHWHPFIEDTVQDVVRDGANHLIGIALAPHYSKLSIGGYENAVRRGLAKQRRNIPYTMVRSWHIEHHLINALSIRVQASLRKLNSPSKAAVLFTAHSLPKRTVMPDDPYQNQLLETSRLVAEQARVGYWDFAFQSAGEPTDAWLGPQLREQIVKLSEAGFKREILVCPVGFVSDHLEILYDLDIAAKKFAESLDIRLERTPSLNDDPDFINALASVTKSSVSPEPSASAQQYAT